MTHERLRERQRKRVKHRRSERLERFSQCSLEDKIAAVERKTIVIGHRGAAAYATHNSLASFSRAIELGADMIELDVRVTGDNKLAVYHDCHDSEGRRVDGISMAELQRVHPATRTFEEVLEHIQRCCVKAGTKTKIYVDLK